VVFAIDSTPLYVSYASTDYENTEEIIKDGKKRNGYKLITLKYVGKVKEKKGKEEGRGIFVWRDSGSSE
jgi:hypothetical protein